MIIRAIITALLAVPAFWLTLRYNMHMFQLNTYMNNEQRTWIRRNFRLQWILVFAMALGVLRMLAAAATPVISVSGHVTTGILAWILDILIWLTLIVIILVYRIMKQMSQKKKLVFTPRVKRMTATICVISVLLIAAAALVPLRTMAVPVSYTRLAAMMLVCASLSAVSGMLCFITGSQLWMQMLARSINQPMEKAINRHYINDAKRILSSNPDLKIIGVTGSYGKTSVKFYLETLLRQKYNVLVTPESYNTPMGIVITIRKSLRPSHEIFVCEMGARYVGEIKEDCDLVHPHHGVITSIGPQHLDTFGSIENIRRTKFELADAVPDGGLLFLNGDNEYISEELSVRKGSRPLYESPVMYHSEKTGEGYYASDVTVTNHGTDFTVNAPDGESERFSMKLVGAHNVINVMGAIAVAHEFGISLADLRIPVRKIQSVPHRMEMKNHGDVTIIDDAFNSNPIGSKAAVETLAMMEGMRILITPGMVELGEDEDEYNRKFGTYAADCCDRVFLVGRRHTEPIMEGLLSKGFDQKHIEVFDKVEDAISRAYAVTTDQHKYILLENDLPDNY